MNESQYRFASRSPPPVNHPGAHPEAEYTALINALPASGACEIWLKQAMCPARFELATSASAGQTGGSGMRRRRARTRAAMRVCRASHVHTAASRPTSGAISGRCRQPRRIGRRRLISLFFRPVEERNLRWLRQWRHGHRGCPSTRVSMLGRGGVGALRQAGPFASSTPPRPVGHPTGRK